MMYYDVIIVGAGPAGVSTAYNLLKHGGTCCLIDRAVFPRQKLCGGLITEKTVRLLRELGMSGFSSVIKQKIDRVSILSAGEEVLTVKTNRKFYLVDRIDFDYWMLKRYLAVGGEFIQGEQVVFVDKEKRVIKTANQTLRYGYLVCADGAKGAVSRCVARKPLSYAFGMETESLGNSEHIILDVNVGKDGYLWKFPKGDKILEGFAFSHEDGANYRAIAGELLNTKNVKGAFLPYCSKISVVTDKNILLVGDAAGFVDAVTGEGTYYAVESGRLAAQSLLTEDSVSSYKRLTSKIIKEVNTSGKLIKTFYKFRPLILHLAGSHKDFLRFVCDEQVSMQHCDFSVLKMLLRYRAIK